MHPAKLTFQGIRIHLNQEFEEFQRGMEGALACLSDGGRLGVITWKHSECALLVDTFRKHEAIRDEFPMYNWLWDKHRAEIEGLKKKKCFWYEEPLRPSREEVQTNSRSRSALLHLLTKGKEVLVRDVEAAAYPLLEAEMGGSWAQPQYVKPPKQSRDWGEQASAMPKETSEAKKAKSPKVAAKKSPKASPKASPKVSPKVAAKKSPKAAAVEAPKEDVSASKKTKKKKKKSEAVEEPTPKKKQKKEAAAVSATGSSSGVGTLLAKHNASHLEAWFTEMGVEAEDDMSLLTPEDWLGMAGHGQKPKKGAAAASGVLGPLLTTHNAQHLEGWMAEMGVEEEADISLLMPSDWLAGAGAGWKQ